MPTLNETGIPAALLPKARAWFDREMARLEPLHGAKWADHREWLAEYVQAEIMERVAHVTGARA